MGLQPTGLIRGGTLGVMAGLHTGTQQLHYHPYVPCLITAGGVSTDSSSWFPARNGFLFPLKALAKLTRGKLRAMLRRRRPDLVLLWNAWRKPWVVQITASGEGEQTVVDSLARSVFHLAITNARLVTLDDQAVTIRYKPRKSSVWLTCQIAGDEFMHRFLQHGLPKGLHKVRYFGLWHPRKRDLAARARLLLVLDRPVAPPTAAASQLSGCLSPMTTPLTPEPHNRPYARIAISATCSSFAGSRRETRWDRDPALPTPLP